MVRKPNPGSEWETAPTPTLVVEVLSDSTRRRDHMQKCKFYLDAGVPEYWTVDAEHLTIRVVRPAVEDNLVTTQLTWSPPGATQPLVLAIADVFSDARSRE
jgi:Uma2 family endonuclease